MNPLPPEILTWARSTCIEVIRASRVPAVDGTILFTPDGVGGYGALWTRDFAYLVEHGGEFLDPREVRAAIEVLFAGQRKDGAIPDRVNRQLVPIYQPGSVRTPFGAGPALDNGMFMVSLVYHFHRHFEDSEYVQGVLPALRSALEFIPRNRQLVFNDPQRPSSTYGFQDAVAKGGHDFFCSLLWVIACRQMAELDSENAAHWTEAGTSTEKALALLWDEDRGAYLAATEVCRQVDIWGNAFLVANQIGNADRRKRVARYLESHYAEFMHAGQVRHLPEPEVWDRLFCELTSGTYQNGGYWGTPSGWLVEALETVNSPLAQRTLADLLNFYQQHGVTEWSSPQGKQGPDLYVATILNVWTLIKKHSPGSPL